MKIIDAVQGSPEWSEIRAAYFTASEAPAMLAKSKYTTRDELIRQKATGLVPDVSPELQRLYNRGHAAEADARPTAEKIIGDELFPTVVSDEIDGLPLLASLDGMSMDHRFIWEHKLWSEALATQIKANELESMYRIQIAQQLLITGAEQCLFMASDGDKCDWMWVTPSPADHQIILAGWKNFRDDLANYRLVDQAPDAVGRSPDTLPALRIEVTGMVTASNLAEYKAAAMALIGAVNTDLLTDQDFADAEKAIKWAKDIADRLDAAKQHALSQTASIDELFRTVDAIKEEARIKRLELEKLVKARKDSIRSEIVNDAKNTFRNHVDALNKRLGKPYMPPVPADFAGTIKGKKTITSLRSAVNDELARAKIAANEIADRIQINLTSMREMAADYAFLFSDTAQLVQKENDDLVALVTMRIAAHKDAENKRLDAEREHIRKEEEAKAETKIRNERQDEPRRETEPPVTIPLNTVAPTLTDTASDSDGIAVSLITRGRGPWSVRRSVAGFAVAIVRDDYDILHLETGTARNEACVEALIAMLNQRD